MSGLSGAGETLILNALLTGRFISLHNSDPGNTGAGEVVGTPYARQPASFTTTGNNPTVAANNTVIQFPTATTDWGVVTHFGLWSASAAGNFYGAWPVTTPKSVGIEDTARWDVGTLKIGTDDLGTL